MVVIFDDDDDDGWEEAAEIAKVNTIRVIR